MLTYDFRLPPGPRTAAYALWQKALAFERSGAARFPPSATAVVLFAPGLGNFEELRQIVRGVDRAVSVVTGWLDPDTLAHLSEAGAKASQPRWRAVSS